MKFSWRDGNRLQLLENGEEFFPAVFSAIEQARSEILIETFILFEDKVGLALYKVLLEAAGRGVRIDLTVDGYGTPELSPGFVASLTRAGVRIHVYDPRKRLLGRRINLFRRLHRKIVVIDGVIAFIGGINYSADHLDDYGPEAKQDYALQVEGPVVRDIHRSALHTITPLTYRLRWWRRHARPLAEGSPGPIRGEARALFAARDNHHHRTDIEQHYLEAIRNARSRLLIANAYFFPGYRVLREIRNAARRGVRVRLILQGQPDMPIARFGARMLYNYLLRDGVEIYEYCRRPLHAKVALADYEWSTVGSSNLDPLSLSLNLEANLIIRDYSFNKKLHANLENLLGNDCQSIPLERIVRGYWWRAPLVFMIFHFLRHFPAITGMIPARSHPLTILSEEPEQPRTNTASPLQREHP
ncbi:cardiolipin synthase ClsB [Azomonas macrocytogenes]|uniref:Cardiolipin synthase B n=1 Tax=Azomonas macrocytogenes TaxID=69962 RepID=A0A839SYD1_AZOMA|nr:cardiolipin synthase ClsB [Azomonas macrocytogenes]MBB3102361.1 cardiolipin synthase [Azomonas macrocytogenes]